MDIFGNWFTCFKDIACRKPLKGLDDIHRCRLQRGIFCDRNNFGRLAIDGGLRNDSSGKLLCDVVDDESLGGVFRGLCYWCLIAGGGKFILRG